MLRVALIVAAFACAALAVASCDPQCKEWTSDVFTARGTFVPCDLAVTGLSLTAGVNTYTQTASSSYECESSGSGVQLAITVPVGPSVSAYLVWTYANADRVAVCNEALRSEVTDADLRLLGFSITAPSGMMQSWPATGLSLAVCSPQNVVEALLDEPRCFSNTGAAYLLQGVSDTGVSAPLTWRFSTLLDGTFESISLTFNGTALTTAGAGLVCNYNLGTALIQVYDAASSLWALSWQYVTYASCGEVWQALADGTDDAPRIESAVVVVPGDQVYSWERDSTEQQTTTPLSDREVACSPAQPSPSQAPSRPPLAPANATLPVHPVVNCVSRAPKGPCVAWFGYYNPNNVTVFLPADTEANQVVRRPFVQTGPVPEYFAPGWHNYTMEARFSCSTRGYPGASWKLLTPVPVEVAAQFDNSACAARCLHDVAYDVQHCSRLFDDLQFSDTANTAEVMQCARTLLGSVPDCSEQ